MSICYELVPSLSQRRKGSANSLVQAGRAIQDPQQERTSVRSPTENPAGRVAGEGEGRKENWM